jgi:hypothetical protein
MFATWITTYLSGYDLPDLDLSMGNKVAFSYVTNHIGGANISFSVNTGRSKYLKPENFIETGMGPSITQVVLLYVYKRTK